MTDKQIIIYKKECYNEPYCSLNQVLEQLKRKEQECEELKHKIFRYEELLKHSAMTQNTYTAEEVNIIASGINFVGRGLIIEENIKLSKTLTEIKEIAENAYCLTNGTNKDMANFAKQILQKISEVVE